MPADRFPFTVTFTDADTLEVLDVITVTEPGVMDIRGWAPRRVAVDVEFANGEHTHDEPPV